MARPKGSKNGVRATVAVACARCGKSFDTTPSNAKTARYCSMACYHPTRPEVACRGCGRLYVPHCTTRGKYCSNACKRNRVEKRCPRCSKTFSVMASKSAKYTYCSVACRNPEGTKPRSTCETCGSAFDAQPSRADTARFCCRECSYAPGRVIVICAYCGREHVKKRNRIHGNQGRCCSNRCAINLRVQEGWDPGYIARKRKTGYRTDIEATTETVLIELGIAYSFEHKVGRYSVDFILPDMGVALECDGWQHLTVEGIERDAKRDAALTEKGWRVIHVIGTDIRRDAMATVSAALGLVA